jgi:hypothetical protein
VSDGVGAPDTHAIERGAPFYRIDDPHTLARWRLVLGKTAEQHGISCGGDADAERVERLVGLPVRAGPATAPAAGRGAAAGAARVGRAGAPAGLTHRARLGSIG